MSAALPPYLQLVDTQNGRQDRSVALGVVENMIQSHPNLGGIFSVNDGGAMGALGRLSPFTYMQPIDISLGNPAPIFVFLLLSALFLGAAFALLYNNDIRQKLVK